MDLQEKLNQLKIHNDSLLIEKRKLQKSRIESFNITSQCFKPKSIFIPELYNTASYKKVNYIELIDNESTIILNPIRQVPSNDTLSDFHEFFIKKNSLSTISYIESSNTTPATMKKLNLTLSYGNKNETLDKLRDTVYHKLDNGTLKFYFIINNSNTPEKSTIYPEKIKLICEINRDNVINKKILFSLDQIGLSVLELLCIGNILNDDSIEVFIRHRNVGDGYAEHQYMYSLYFDDVFKLTHYGYGLPRIK